MKYASIGPISTYLPQKIETNQQLQDEFPSWDMDLIYSKTGIASRHIAEPGECASDLGVKAAERLFDEHQIDPQSIDFLLFCTQTPDYPLPTTACLMQQRLGLRVSCGALDFNLGCSGFIYGLSLAEGLIRAGIARRVLFITAETYSKYIDADDRSLRTIFGDGAAATLIEAAPEPTLGGFQFGTDGSGADTLMVPDGGARPADQAHKPRHRKRWNSRLYMDGPALINFTVGAIPELVRNIFSAAGIPKSDVKLYLFHQATRKMLEQLQEALEIDSDRMPIALETVGNTVSATIPLMIHDLRKQNRLTKGAKHLLVGFGVGWSWGGCIWHDHFGNGD
ncbi:ketoacyl-ACP synthase III [Bremerella alba]|uniref:3-oxoacyl-[acyl-carrier-protein] synthase 3 n=1 Tax=Bremerella alba TaxID=980252 RepID=A0A7V9A7H4_9BACT|nr:ketoacyl-ACP synthase III [Bremerella alba]MBA2115041.1 3-oxoacyl-[acyl-carrier-protein] synthase 3 [Bremerella alba]